MKARSRILARLRLDPKHYLLSGRAVMLLKEFFDIIDVRRMHGLDDIQFVSFMTEATGDYRHACNITINIMRTVCTRTNKGIRGCMHDCNDDINTAY